jgi:LmbE family N-acetylglucosaminyl deacetylase
MPTSGSIALPRPPDWSALGLCPLPRELAIPAGIRALVFAPHPDDETLGCGGTLACLAAAGSTVKIVVVTDGAGAGALAAGAVEARRREFRAAIDILGVRDAAFLAEPDGAFRSSARFERVIADLLQEFRPDWVFLPSLLDYHRDHVALAHALLDCLAGCGTRLRRFLYEVWTPLPATRIVDITEVLDRKLAAICCHRTALEHLDYRAGSHGLAAFRGLYLPRAQKPRYAEAFLELEADGEFASRLIEFRLLLERELAGG